jgi:transcription elongation factor GreA
MPPTKPVPITPRGLAKLEAELQELISVKRPEAAANIQQTREDSPGSQNEGEYEEAKNEQAFIEGRIQAIQQILANSEIIDEKVAHQKDMVHVGATVTVMMGRREQDFTIVGMPEVDAAHGFISDESPVGRALLGQKIGDTVEVDAPAGTIKIKIKQIK